MLLLNVRSLNKHLDELQVFLKTLESLPTVICLVETWIRDENYENHFLLDGYKSIKTKNRTKKGGGIAVFCKEGVEIVNKFSTNYEESLGVEVIIGVQKLFMITFYVPPTYKRSFLEFFDKYLETFVDNSSKVIICGDFNIDRLCHSSIGKEFENIICTTGFHLLDSGSTRRTTILESNLDLFLTNFDKNCCAIETVQYDITDHFPVLLHWKQSPYQIKKIDFVHRIKKDFNCPKLLKNFECHLVRKLQVLVSNHKSLSVSLFQNCTTEVIDRFQPLVTGKCHQKKIG